MRFSTVKKAPRLLSTIYRDTDPGTWRATFAALCLLILITLLSLGMTCSVGQNGLNREQALYTAGTNIVGSLHTVTPYLPPPANYMAEALLGAAAAALAAWSAAQQRQIQKLKNGNGATRTLPPAPSGAPTP